MMQACWLILLYSFGTFVVTFEEKSARRTSERTKKGRQAGELPKRASPKTALITGASGGIGFDLARIFAENGYDLVLVSRSREKLLELADHVRRMFGREAHVLPKDLSEPFAPEEIYREIVRRRLEIDVLVNNAGYGILGPLAYTDKRDQLGLLQVNVVSLLHLTRLFLPGMLQRGRGRILNIASTAGFQPGPLMANYYASKAYVLSFSVALSQEVRGTGVSVSVLCPGPTPTGFQQRAGIRRQVGIRRLAALDSLAVARIGFEGLMAGKGVIVPGLLNKIGTFLVRLAPLELVARTVMKFQSRISQ